MSALWEWNQRVKRGEIPPVVPMRTGDELAEVLEQIKRHRNDSLNFSCNTYAYFKTHEQLLKLIAALLAMQALEGLVLIAMAVARA